jgi:hypothetical protein
MMKTFFPVSALLIGFLVGEVGFAEAQSSKETVTLLGMLNEWIYPGAKSDRAEMSDAGVTGISAIKCQAILTTPDPFEKVLAHYLKKLNVDADGDSLDEKKGERTTSNRSIQVQKVSQGGSGDLVVINIRGQNSSMTLVFSRSRKDEVTHIAWSNYRQMTP